MPQVTYTPDGQAYDFAIGGIPFLSAAAENAPHRRETAPYRKEQTDQSAEAGEQSLSFWWTRSQSSFHSGAGQRFLDGAGDDPFRTTRFDYSKNLDVWTQGEVKLLSRMNAIHASAVYQVEAADTVGGVWFLGSHTAVYSLWHRSSDGVYTQAAGITGDEASFAVVGKSIYLLTDTGVWAGDRGNPGVAFTRIYAAPPTVSSTFIFFLKERLIVVSGGKLYELSNLTGAATAWPAAFYTHPRDGKFVFKVGAESPAGFYVGGTENRQSVIYHVTVTIEGGTPTLGAPTEVLRLPDGERLWDSEFAMKSYLNKFLVIATWLGVRVAKVSADGSLDLGGLTLDPATTLPTGAWWFAGFGVYGRFVYTAVKGLTPAQAGTRGDEVVAVRIDLGQEVADGLYAWAQDMTTGDQALFPSSMCVGLDGRVTIAGDSSTTGMWQQDALNYATDGYLVTSRIRFSTNEDKIFERLQVSGEGQAGTITATPLVGAATGTSVASLTADAGVGVVRSAEQRIEDDFAGKRGQFVQVKVTLTPTTAPRDLKARGYQLKALPAQKRQRVEQIPVLLFDIEKDHSGQLIGEQGTAYTRLCALEAMEETGSVVTLQRFGPYFSTADDRLCVVDRVEFVQTASPTSQGSGWGGVAMITVRMVD